MILIIISFFAQAAYGIWCWGGGGGVLGIELPEILGGGMQYESA